MDDQLQHDWSCQDVIAFAQYIESLLPPSPPPCICLQFPDQLLPISVQACVVNITATLCSRQQYQVHRALRTALDHANVSVNTYILADSTYHSTAVDEVAAQHIKAHAIVRLCAQPHACNM